MAYNVVPPPLPQVPETGLGISTNFNGSGIFSPNYLTSDQAADNIKNLLLTTVGEHPHNIEFGTTLLYIIFEPNISELKQEIESIITDAVSAWIPYISIEDIDIKTAEDDPNLNYNISISITFSVNELATQTVIINVDNQGVLDVSNGA